LGRKERGSFGSNRWLDFCWINDMKAIVGKIRRSGVYYLMTKTGPINEVRYARLDTWGTVTVLVVLLVVIGLMRLLLAA
jgi:hypothetical protein